MTMSIEQALKAGTNAMHQMAVALRYSDDPAVIAKCWLFVAMSQMQQGRLARANTIIRFGPT